MTDPSSEAHELPFYDGKVFRVVSATDNSQTTAETRFHYHQCGAALWGEYAGGGIALGRLIGRVAADGAIVMRYCHLDRSGNLCSGVCASAIISGAQQPLRLLEKWRWTDGRDGHGESEIEEIAPKVDKARPATAP